MKNNMLQSLEDLRCARDDYKKAFDVFEKATRKLEEAIAPLVGYQSLNNSIESLKNTEDDTSELICSRIENKEEIILEAIRELGGKAKSSSIIDKVLVICEGRGLFSPNEDTLKQSQRFRSCLVYLKKKKGIVNKGYKTKLYYIVADDK